VNDGKDTDNSYWISDYTSSLVTDFAARIREDVQRAVSQQEIKTESLRRSMAYHHNMRHKDFDFLTRGLEARCRESRNRVLDALERFCAEEKDINERVESFLARQGLVTGREQFEMLDDLRRQVESRKRMEQALFEFFRRQGELRVALDEMLASVSKLKSCNLRLIIKELETHWQNSYFAELLHRLRRGWGADVPAALACYSFLATQGGGDMRPANEMKDLVDHILSDRRQRNDYILNLQQDVKKRLEELRGYHEEMAQRLQSTLQAERSKRLAGEEERMDSFNDAQSALYTELSALRRGTQQRLAQFQRERENLEKRLEALFDQLRKDLAEGEEQRLADFRAQYLVIEEKTKVLYEETARWLKEFNTHRREMAATLRLILKAGKEDLNRENQERLRAFEVFMGELRRDLSALLDETQDVLRGYREDLKGAAAAWRLVWVGIRKQTGASANAALAVEAPAPVDETGENGNR
jgi:hypothetical protein